jgi:hypothetical protein
MKTTYKIILGFMILGFIGCGEGSSNSAEMTEQNGPKSPVLNEKEKVPPSIPNI